MFESPYIPKSCAILQTKNPCVQDYVCSISWHSSFIRTVDSWHSYKWLSITVISKCDCILQQR